MEFARFMASFSGRALRVIVGVGIIWWGMRMGSAVGTLIAIVGVLPVLAGVLNVCGIASLIGAPFRGKDIPPKSV